MKKLLYMLMISLIILSGCKKSNQQNMWKIATGEYEGNMMIARFLSGIPEGIDTKDYSDLVLLSWKYQPADEKGMPTKKVNFQMVLLEDLLEESLESNNQAFLAAVITCNGIKEWQWYSRDKEITMKSLNKALSGHEAFPIEIIFIDDPEWSGYFEIQKSVK